MIRSLSGESISVIDAQVHLNFLGLPEAIAAMDAVGIDRVIIDEWWGWDDRGTRIPHYVTEHGTSVHQYPLAIEACMRYPERFRYVAWYDRRDPDLPTRMAYAKLDPNCVAIRLSIRPQMQEDIGLETGQYDLLLKSAGEHSLPVMLSLSRVPRARRRDLLRRVFERHSGTEFIADHCAALPLSPEDEDLHVGLTALSDCLAYADLPNVTLKWSHAPLVSSLRFPFRDVADALAAAVSEFGADRVMWASDTTQTYGHHSWLEALLYISESTQLTKTEKSQVLGGTASRVLGWPE